MTNHISKKLFSRKRYNTNWILEKITVKPSFYKGYSMYSLTFENLVGIIFFEDFAFIENEITDMFPEASNFCLLSGTLSNPRISFIT